MNNRIATFLSVVFHPLIVTTYLFGILFILAPDLVGVNALDHSARGSLLLLIFLNTFVAPTVVIYYFQRFGLISSLHIDDLKERRLPYLATVILYAISTYLFGWRLQPIGELAPQISIILGSVTASLLMVMLVSLVWKISAHATAVGGLVGMFLALLTRFDESLLLYPLIAAILLGGCILSARLHLNAHTPKQILAGFTGGLLISNIAVYFFF